MKRPQLKFSARPSVARLRGLLLTASVLVGLATASSLYLLNGPTPLVAAADGFGGTQLPTDHRTCLAQLPELPGAATLSAASPALSLQIDQPESYVVYGSTMRQVQSQIERCAPHQAGDSAEYTAQTSYNLNWAYDVTNTDGRCSLSDAKVGLHVTQTLPDWQPLSGEPAPLTARWRTFITALRTHEDGHVAIDKRFAAELLADLQAFPAADCTDFQSRVEHLANQDVAELNQANDNYDVDTAHGATQGAMLPH